MAHVDDPFTEQDLEVLLHEESCNNEKEGWHFVKKTDCAEIWKKDDDTTPIKLVKSFLTFPGIPPADVIELMYNIEIRRKWEKHFPVIEVVEELPKYKIVYWQVKMPPGVTNRDLVQYATYRKHSDKNFEYIMYKNATDPRKPELNGFIRAKTILSGVIIRADENDPNTTKLTVLMQNDPMGLIPKPIVNLFASKTPIEWHEELSKYYHTVYCKEKSH